MHTIQTRIKEIIEEMTGAIPSNKKQYRFTKHEQPGRVLEIASGFGLWLIAYSILVNSDITLNSFMILPMFWAWIAFTIGVCQIIYSGLSSRLIFTAVASAVWSVVAAYSFAYYGTWNLTTAASVPFAVFNFYVYGFVFHEWSVEHEAKHNNRELQHASKLD